MSMTVHAVTGKFYSIRESSCEQEPDVEAVNRAYNTGPRERFQSPRLESHRYCCTVVRKGAKRQATQLGVMITRFYTPHGHFLHNFVDIKVFQKENNMVLYD